MATSRETFQKLQALRGVFLGEAAGRRDDYWANEEILESYHLFFGARIRMKWDAVLGDALTRGFAVEKSARVVDWGCGTGVATLALLPHRLKDLGAKCVLFDRSAAALRYAAERVAEAAPGIAIETTSKAPDVTDAIVLLSHVVNELSADALSALVASLANARAVIWVEPGTPACSRAVIAVREKLRSTQAFQIVAPCTHAEACGMLAPSNARHWCHFFGAPDPMVFRNADWRKFSDTLKVDLRSLPTSYLVLQRAAVPPAPAPLRVVGRARHSTGYTTVLGCAASGVSDAKRLKKHDPKEWKRLRDGDFAEYLDLRPRL